MTNVIIYHNPRCSKSRETLALIQKQGVEPQVVEYLKTPLTYEELLKLRVHFSLKALVRANEPGFKARNLSLDDEESVLKAVAEEPKLMQRPIVTYKDSAVIGRPPENVLALLSHASI